MTFRIQLGLSIAAACILLAQARPAAAVTYDLRADASTVTPAGSATPIPIWGFADDTGVTPGSGAVTLPGPVLRVPSGEPLTIHLTNDLPVPVSIMIPGQPHAPPPAPIMEGGRVRSFAVEAPPGGMATYTFPSLREGTYLYQSSTNPAVQIPMGLYGALIVGDPPAGTTEQLLLYSELDPELNAAVAANPAGPHSPGGAHPRYALVNGLAYPDTPSIDVVADSSIYFRFLNAGWRTFVPTAPGIELTAVSEDGYALAWPRRMVALEFAAGKTIDALATAPDDGTFVLFDRRLSLSNAGARPGGAMVAFQIVTPPLNTPPVVDAGADQTVPPGTVVLLHGSASDADGPGPLTVAWSRLSGPGTATFGDATAAHTTVTFSDAGTHVLQLAASDGLDTSADTTTILVVSGPPAAPAGVVADRITFTSVNVTWTDLSSDETEFQVERRQQDGGVVSPWAAIDATAADTTLFLDAAAPRAPFRLYQYRVRSANPAGSSSAAVSSWIP
jgi:FtsP/CotA-like multicopper oxidase with cupredoxin domain